LAALMIQNLFVASDHCKTPYSECQQLVGQGKATDLVVGPIRMIDAYANAVDRKAEGFSARRVESGLAQTLAKGRPQVLRRPERGLLPTVLGWLMPAVGLARAWMFLVPPMATGTGRAA
jgi:cell division protease FtsH